MTSAEQLEKDRAMHKTAARVWFNLMEATWPPRLNDGDYWEDVSLKMAAATYQHQDNILLKKLVLMLYDYMVETAKERDENAEGNV